MHTLAKKSKAAEQPTSAGPAGAERAHRVGAGAPELPSSKALLPPLRAALRSSSAFGYDSRREGETLGTAPEPEVEGSQRFGEAEVPIDFVGPLQPGDTRAVPHNFAGAIPAGATRSSSFHPTITVVDAGARTSDCGGYQYKVRWGIPASETASSGWIVQRVDKTFTATDCTGAKVNPTAFDDPAGYPFWEAWEFTAGQNVWVGHASGGSPHSGDSFGAGGYGPGTKGKKVITGEVKAIVGFVPPAGMTARNAAPAWALPYTRTEPPQFASTLGGAEHSLTAEWNCCPSGTVTQPTAVTAVP
jgi:hypothetical protein